MSNQTLAIIFLSLIFLCGLWTMTVFRARIIDRVERERMIHETQEREKDRQLQRELMKAAENTP